MMTIIIINNIKSREMLLTMMFEHKRFNTEEMNLWGKQNFNFNDQPPIGFSVSHGVSSVTCNKQQ